MISQNIQAHLQSSVAQLKAKYSNMTSILTHIAAMVESAIMDNFAQGGRWDGSGTDIMAGGSQKWKPLAESTKKGYRKLGYELVPTLHRSGILEASIDVRPYGKSSILVSSNLEYAAVHNFGSKDKSVPARPFVTLTEKDLDDILKKLISFL
jgi:phage gpG-like protein